MNLAKLIGPALVIGALLIGSAPALGQDNPAFDISQLMLKISDDSGDQVTFLACDPASGPHPNAADACAALEAVNGDLNALKGADRACTMELHPVTATAVGVWHGKNLNYQSAEFANPCVLGSEKGVVFDFWDQN